MDAEQLWDTTMDPEKRILTKSTIWMMISAVRDRSYILLH